MAPEAFPSEIWPDVPMKAVRGELAYAKLKGCDWKKTNYRVYGGFFNLHLNRLSRQLTQMEDQVVERLSRVEDERNSQDRPGDSKTLDQLMDESLPKLTCYSDLLVAYNKIREQFELPSRKHLAYQREFEHDCFKPGTRGDFGENGQPIEEFRSLARSYPRRVWADWLFLAIYKLTGRRGNSSLDDSFQTFLAEYDRATLETYAVVPLCLLVVLLFFVPIPILYFRLLSGPATMIILNLNQVIFAIFVIFSAAFSFEFLTLVCLAYAALLVQATSNWLHLD